MSFFRTVLTGCVDMIQIITWWDIIVSAFKKEITGKKI